MGKEVFLGEVRRVLTTLEQAMASTKAAATGYRGTLRIALSDGIAPPWLAALLAQCREEEPDVEIRLFEVPLAEQAKGLRSGLYDAGFAQAAEVGEGIVVKSVWSDPLVTAVPTRHPLLAHKRIPLAELIRYPLVPCHPEICEGCYRQIKRILRTVDTEPIVAEYAATLKLAYRPGDQPPTAICTLLLPCDDGTMRHIALQPLPRRLTGHRCAEKIVVRICSSRRASRKPEPTQ